MQQNLIHLGLHKSAQQTEEMAIMKGLLLTICFIFCAVQPSVTCTLNITATTTPLYRYWMNTIGNHFYTTDPNEAATLGTNYKLERISGLIYKYEVLNSVPLFRYYSETDTNHFYTTDATEVGTTVPGKTGNNGYKSQGVTGFCMPEQTTDTIPLYRYYKTSAVDHLYTTNIQDIDTAITGQGAYGYQSQGVACYILPA